ncbi:DUF7065 domain-containing protein [Rhodococcus opacus]|uniref:DUF7065 domain-containing protein n=1 Tax=Rhodococcus opacus TaxID=37919 RepID=A0A076F045_RHOOP|nr:hypothetical protein [Rhodococcus opacus]AII10817.1 hypothetical protein EP51_42350 [Rhodococcus opacus]
MALHFDDDATAHTVTDAVDWRESYYLNFADPTSGLHGVAWQGVRPNMGHGEAVFVLYDGPTPLIHSVNMAVPIPADIGAERTDLGHQSFECVEPWRRWDVHYDDGTNSAHLEWTQMTETCDWDWEELTGAKHYQGAGRIEVTAVVDGRQIAFTGFGERDRAWGPRNYGPIEFSWWTVAQFPDEVAVHAFVQFADGKYRLHGFLHADGTTRPLSEFRAAEVVYDPADGPALSSRQIFTDDEGRTVEALNERVHYLQFGTSEDGAQLEERDPGDQATGRMYLTFQKFTRVDGVEGRGMIDNNLRIGTAPTAFTAQLPNFSNLYDYGLPTIAESLSGERN